METLAAMVPCSRAGAGQRGHHQLWLLQGLLPKAVSKQSPAPNQVGKQQANAGTGLISHQVEYQCGGFVEKNRDAVPEELVGLLRASKVRATVSRGCVGQRLGGLWVQEPRAGMMMV